jgi:hypothetical protein
MPSRHRQMDVARAKSLTRLLALHHVGLLSKTSIRSVPRGHSQTYSMVGIITARCD